MPLYGIATPCGEDQSLRDSENLLKLGSTQRVPVLHAGSVSCCPVFQGNVMDRISDPYFSLYVFLCTLIGCSSQSQFSSEGNQEISTFEELFCCMQSYATSSAMIEVDICYFIEYVLC